MKADEFCAACPVQRGLCPNCGTFWIVTNETYGKRVGVRPVDRNALVAAGGDTTHPPWIDHWPNVVTEGYSPADQWTYPNDPFGSRR